MADNIQLGCPADRPQDALNNVSDVLDMLTCFLASVDDLDLFQRNDKNGSISGLYTVLDACGKTIGAANDEMCERLERSVDLERVTGGIPEVAYANASGRRAWLEGFEAGIAAYREHGANAQTDTPVDDNCQTETVSVCQTSGELDAIYPRLSARDHAIASAVKEGYDLPEVAKAVNLKRATVERIVTQLRDDGVLPQASELSAAPESVSA